MEREHAEALMLIVPDACARVNAVEFREVAEAVLRDPSRCVKQLRRARLVMIPDRTDIENEWDIDEMTIDDLVEVFLYPSVLASVATRLHPKFAEQIVEANESV